MSLPLLKQYRQRLNELIGFAEAKLDFMRHSGQAPASEISYGYSYVNQLRADIAPLNAEIVRLEKPAKANRKGVR